MLGAREEGFEPPTYGFEGHCSTTELLPHKNIQYTNVYKRSVKYAFFKWLHHIDGVVRIIDSIHQTY